MIDLLGIHLHQWGNKEHEKLPPTLKNHLIFSKAQDFFTWDTWTIVNDDFFYDDINDVFQWSVLIESAIIVYFFSIYIHIIERGSRSTRSPRLYILYTTTIHVTLVNVVLVKNEWSAAQTRVDSKTSVTVYTILEHLQVSHAHVWHLF